SGPFRTCVAPADRRAAINYRTRKRTWPNWTGLLPSATTSAMTPLVSALISFITFIASMMQTTVSSLTFDPTSTKGGASGDAARYNVPTIGDTISFRGTLSIGFGVAVVG